MAPLRYVALIAILTATGSAEVKSQGLESSEIRGTIRDTSNGVIRQASITVSSTALIGGARSILSDERGAYSVPALPPGTYSLRVETPGFAPVVRDQIVLALATTATIDLVMNVASVRETVTISTEGPIIDVRSSAIVTTLDEHLLQALPTPRSVSSTLALAPGVFSPATNRDLVVAYGGTINSNGLYIDGVEMTEPRRQSPLLPVNYNWIDQMQIGGLGADAEYGEFTGAFGNAVFRSGSNRFSALADYWTTRWSWVGRNGSSLGGRELLRWWDVSAQAGGPIRTDKLWFFAGAQLSRKEDRPLNYSGQFTRDQWTPRAMVKLTHALAAAGRLEGHFQRNAAQTDGANAGPFTAEDALNTVKQSDTSWNVRFTRALADVTLLELRHGGYASNRRDDPTPPRTRDDPPPTIEDGRLLRGNSNVYQDQRPVQLDAEAILTREMPRFLRGAHTLQAGIDVKWHNSVTAQGFPGGRRLFTNGGRLTTVSVWTGDRTEASGRRAAFYLQDRWAVARQATLNLGLRADLNRGSVPETGTVLATNTMSPRVGITWALDRSYTAALKVHYGRYYDALLTERVAFMDIPGIGTTTGYTVDPSGQLTEVFRSAPPGARAIDPDIRLAHADQYLIGFERRLFKEAVFQAHYVRRDYDDFMAMTDTGSQWTPVELRDPGPDGRVGTADDGGVIAAYRQVNPGQQFLYYTNPPDAFRRYDALQLVVTRRWSGAWQVQASYTWAKTRATVGNGDFTNAGLNDTGDQPGTRSPGAFMNPNGRINAEGAAVFDKDEFKLLGVYRVPVLGGINVSGIVSRLTGTRWERVVIYQNALIPGNFQTIRMEPRGSRETDPVWNLDLRIEPTVRLPFGPGALGVAFDVFNATNQGTPLALDGASGGGFGTAITRSDPRTLQVLGRYRW